MRTLILCTFLYACESWTLTAEIGRRLQALEMRWYRRLLTISYKDHVTNEEVRNRIQKAIGVHDDLLTLVKKRKLRWYGHISRSSGMAKIIVQGTVKGVRKRGRQKKRLEDNIKEWTGMGFGDFLRAAEDRKGWKDIVATSSVVPRRPPRLRGWGEMRWIISVSWSLFSKEFLYANRVTGINPDQIQRFGFYAPAARMHRALGLSIRVYVRPSVRPSVHRQG